MEALLVDEIPLSPGWLYEPKWDGFRCIAFRNGSEVALQSKAGRPLTRYFPELAETFLKLKPKHFILDGEIVIAVRNQLSFDDLLQRIHPAASRVQKLAKEFPGTFIAFDLLQNENAESLLNVPLAERRRKLEQFAAKYFKPAIRVRLSPSTTDLRIARNWFERAGTDLDGIIAKQLDREYEPGGRTAVIKVKPVRTADCVVGGFRYASKKKAVGSLLLGLYDDSGLLNHVGFCSGLKAGERKTLLRKLEPLVNPPGFTGRAPGGPSRWSTERSVEWKPLKPKLVVEVSYDHFTGDRFRHGTRLIRWRPDKSPQQCRMDQIASTSRGALALLHSKT